MTVINFGNKTISKEGNPYIIAEIGVNHEGSMDRAKKLISLAKDGGADAVSAINTVIGMGIDIKTKKPKLYTNIGGLSGPAIKPIAIANIHKIFNNVNIPIIGIGGIANAEDVIEFILAGAHLVQIGTQNYINPAVGTDIVTKLEKYCKDNKTNNLLDLKGQISYHG